MNAPRGFFRGTRCIRETNVAYSSALIQDTMGKKGKIFVGTSGWHYKHWIGTFYPEDMKSPQFTAYYVDHFSTVEINNSFYKLPSKETFESWASAVPKDFIFSVKANRFMTHMKKLKDPKTTFNNLIENAAGLKEKLGPILFQLPPRWKYNEQRFRAFLEVLPVEYRYTVEFRDPSWYTDSVYQLLRENNIAFCIYELEHHQSPAVTTAEFVYIRLHGPGNKYEGSYNDATLTQWSKSIKAWQSEGKNVFIYFDNDQNGYAAVNAKKLKEILSI